SRPGQHRCLGVSKINPSGILQMRMIRLDSRLRSARNLLRTNRERHARQQQQSSPSADHLTAIMQHNESFDYLTVASIKTLHTMKQNDVQCTALNKTIILAPLLLPAALRLCPLPQSHTLSIWISPLSVAEWPDCGC